MYDEKRILLVPKAAVRFRLAADHQAYYRHFVLEYLQAEHLDAGSSLVKVLKNGKRVVYKNKLEEIYPLSKEFLFEFSEKHPEVLERYKKSLPSIPVYPIDEEIEQIQPDPREIDVVKLMAKLESIEPGSDSASTFHSFIVGALESIFYPGLRSPVKEQKIHGGRKRIDIVFNNGADRGFFFDLTIKHRIKCPLIFFECKNYSSDPKNPEFDQLTGRFSDKRGIFGVLVCRTVNKKEDMLKRQLDIVHDNRGYVLVLDDSNIKELLQLRSNRNYKGIDIYLENLFRQLLL